MMQQFIEEEQYVFKTLSCTILFAVIGMSAYTLVQAQSPAPAAKAKPATTAIATFAGGCFWCMRVHSTRLMA